MGFREDINGLRALAVLSVVIFHFMPDMLPGGFSGVDIFFVISGYLMTSIIFKGIDTGSFNLLDFYLARANRIIPALLVLCLGLLIYGWFFLLPAEYIVLGKHVASSMSFLSNILYWKEVGYFATGSHEKWLLHTWSLSVEWQFYILYPIFLLALSKCFNRNILRWVLLYVTLLLFGLSAYASYQWPDATYYMFPTRAWEMMIGGMPFLFHRQYTEAQKRFLVGLGVLGICVGLVAVSEETPWPGLMGLFPVCGTVLIIVANKGKLLLSNSRGVQLLGRMSYSVYLWHWPIVVQLSFLGYSNNSEMAFIGITCSLLMGYVSYALVEKKFNSIFNLSSLSRVFCATVPITIVASLIYFSGGVVSSIRSISHSDKAIFIVKYQQIHKNLAKDYWLKCNAYKSIMENGNTQIDDSCTAYGEVGGVFLWGDSHAEALSYGIRNSLPSELAFYQVTSAGCKPSFTEANQKGNLKKACDDSNKFAISKIRELQPKVVIVAQQNQHELVDWGLFYQQVKELGVEHVILSGPLPQWQPSLPIAIAKRHWGESGNRIVDSSLDKSIIKTNNLIKHKLNQSGIIFVNVFDNICDFKNGEYTCLVKVAEGKLITVDYGHLSKDGSLYVVSKYLYPAIKTLY